MGRRLGALIYDGALVLALWLGLTALHLAFLRLVLNQPVEAVGASAWAVWSLRGLLVVSTTLFFCCFWHRAGMTLGMQAWRLKVQTLEGQPLSIKQCLVRCAFGWLSLAALGLGYAWIMIDRQHRSWSDIASHTRTVLLPKS